LRPTSASSRHFGKRSSSARELNAFADGDDDVGVLQPLHELIEIARGLAITNNVVMADQGKAFQLIHHVLVIVGDGNLHDRERGRAESFVLALRG
jgi:hypothetical protein